MSTRTAVGQDYKSVDDGLRYQVCGASQTTYGGINSDEEIKYVSGMICTFATIIRVSHHYGLWRLATQTSSSSGRIQWYWQRYMAITTMMLVCVLEFGTCSARGNDRLDIFRDSLSNSEPQCHKSSLRRVQLTWAVIAPSIACRRPSVSRRPYVCSGEHIRNLDTDSKCSGKGHNLRVILFPAQFNAKGKILCVPASRPVASTNVSTNVRISTISPVSGWIKNGIKSSSGDSRIYADVKSLKKTTIEFETLGKVTLGSRPCQVIVDHLLSFSRCRHDLLDNLGKGFVKVLKLHFLPYCEIMEQMEKSEPKLTTIFWNPARSSNGSVDSRCDNDVATANPGSGAVKIFSTYANASANFVQ
ncbi:hypothetical protein AG1IA_07443 [Rhizoctonia solani AG-1 IA]|uniref:Uncharacterized protein n=1 Tax=Thanatephorus cucumeris (strain AG1-IA) TaxID=983506 RepID=L8WK15_THACA|nr:hypothetical protein AG1IA_07443 [Rhizoctonia solani AG-1 IA]